MNIQGKSQGNRGEKGNDGDQWGMNVSKRVFHKFSRVFCKGYSYRRPTAFDSQYRMQFAEI